MVIFDFSVIVRPWRHLVMFVNISSMTNYTVGMEHATQTLMVVDIKLSFKKTR